VRKTNAWIVKNQRPHHPNHAVNFSRGDEVIHRLTAAKFSLRFLASNE